MTFYFDEAFHDKKITYKNESLNLEKKDVEEFYVGCYIGSDEWQSIENAALELERKYKQKLGMSDSGELKSTAFLNMSKLRYGLSSLPQRTFEFYSELFEIMCGRVRMHFSVQNKYELLIKECIPNADWFDMNGIIYTRFIYSFTKFMIMHSQYDLPGILFSKRDSKWKKKQISSVFQTHIELVKGIKKKKTELDAVVFMNYVINLTNFYFHSIPDKLHWKYEFSPALFRLYCDEMHLVPELIVVDKEKDTVEAVKEVFSCEVTDDDSKLNCRLRICDWVAGFFSKMLLSYDRDYKNDTENDLTENIHFLDERFFRQDAQFKDFMQLLYDLLIDQQQGYWATSGTVYADQAICFYTFLRYYDSCRQTGKTPDAVGFNLELSRELGEAFDAM